jgi:hypothetical protein
MRYATLTAVRKRHYGPPSACTPAQPDEEEEAVARRITAITIGVVLGASVGGLSIARAQGLAGPASIRQLVRTADAVLRVRILVGTATLELEGRACPIVHADVLEPIKGTAGSGAFTFANIGSGAASFADGEEVILFLQHSERVAELAATPFQTRLRYVAIPNAREKLVLHDADRDTVTGAIRGYATVETIPDPDLRAEQLRNLTLEILKTGSPVLITSAMRDVTPAGDAAALTLADLPALVPLIESSRMPVGTRIALVAELERRGLVFGPARWVRLLRTSRGSDLVAVIGAVRDHPSAGVDAQLFPVLDDRDFRLATAAATSLGVPGNTEAVRPLVVSLGRDDAELRLAAVRSLGRIGTQSARQALELTGARHPDAATRRRAETEAIMLARRHGTTLASSLGLSAAEASLAAAPAESGAGVLR